ncbi:methylated-DNA--[protein]-cysteine S-methyltransferase [Clostridium sp. 1001275B_160808_H3]|uniref:methylated-DNA--[protein]-cysteine S-methyltransferase n=1 Tax=Clostridium sp. 1001275B_160808_H3 TaxID=2787110 RepID=UPI001899C711|nr:methylated-DNA--[protein]-cysteine S-methyltransferase [Clostridium sp. 1001275B_160808_H3]
MEECREKLYFYKIDSIIGPIYIVKSVKGLRMIELIEEEWIKFKGKNSLIEDKNICLDVIIQLNEYFAGERRNFDLKVDIEGTDFRKLVWNELIKIPYGEIRSYSYIASSIGNEKAARAIGQANRANPIPIVIPCHRVAGKTGRLLGYAGSHTDIQEKLIKFEEKNIIE